MQIFNGTRYNKQDQLHEALYCATVHDGVPPLTYPLPMLEAALAHFKGLEGAGGKAGYFDLDHDGICVEIIEAIEQELGRK